MAVRSWGRLVQRQLVSLAPLVAMGCGAGPQPATPSAAPPLPPPGPAAAAPSPVADPAGAAPGVGAFVRVNRDAASALAPNAYAQVLAFGGGAFAIAGFEQDASTFGRPRCALETPWPEVCEFFAVAPWMEGQEKSAWPAATLDAAPGAWRAYAPLPAAFRALSPGKRGVYASLAGTHDEVPFLQVHFLGLDGPSELLLEESPTRFTEALIVETRAGLLGVFQESGDGSPLVSGRLVGEKGQRRIERGSELRIGDVGDKGDGGRATDARAARELAGRAGDGPMRAVALLDAAGAATDEALLVWVEVIPPRSHDLAREARERTERRKQKSKHSCARLDRSAFEGEFRRRRGQVEEGGCGGRQSRALSDPAVKKRLHLTRLSAAGKPLDDHAYPLAAGYAAEKTQLDVWPVPGGGVTVNGVAFDAKLGRLDKPGAGPLPLETPSPLSTPPTTSAAPVAQRLLQAMVDEPTGEALLLFYEENHAGSSADPLDGAMYAARYSALGEPVGEVTKLVGDSPAQNPYAAPSYGEPVRGADPLGVRAAAGWVVLSSGWGVHLVGGPRDGAFLPLPRSCDAGGLCPESQEFSALAPIDPARAELLGTCNHRPCAATLDLAALSSGAPSFPEVSPDARPVLGPTGAMRGAGGLLSYWARGSDGQAGLVLAAAREPADAGADAAPDGGAGGTRTGRDHDRDWLQAVWGDHVLMQKRGPLLTATWLRAGATIPIDIAVLQDAEPEGQPLISGSTPVLPGRRFLLPAEPGQPIEAPPQLTRALAECPYALPTGPRRLLLACTEPASAKQPEISAGVRVARY